MRELTVRYSIRLFRVVPQKLNETVEEHASYNHNDGQNSEPRSHHGWNIRNVVTVNKELPEVERQVAVSIKQNEDQGMQAQGCTRDQEYSTHVLRHLTLADPVPVHNSSRSDQDERLPPSGPERSQRNPE